MRDTRDNRRTRARRFTGGSVALLATAALCLACNPDPGSAGSAAGGSGTAHATTGASGRTPGPGRSTPHASPGRTPGTTPSSPTPSPRRTPTPTPTHADPPPPGAQLPRGGRTLFPRYRLVGYVGAPGSPSLGRLGIGDLDDRLSELESRYDKAYADGRAVQPVAELIAVTVLDHPGRDGLYRSRRSDDTIEDYLEAARRHKALLLLNIQPGRARFVDEVKALSRWLREPDVGIALDPEWAMGPGQRPGHVFGHIDGHQLDEVGAYLSGIVAANHLPQKVMVVHELAPNIIRDESAWHEHPGVATIKSVDGIGTRPQKVSTWGNVNRDSPGFVHPGFKLFYDEDTRHGSTLMTPAQVLALRPEPDYVMYE